MNRKTKFFILIFSFVALCWFCIQPITEIGASKQYMQMPEAGEELSAEELQDFLTLWAQVMNGSMKDSIGQMSLRTKDSYPKDVELWLKAQNWSAERFFYDEQRIREILEFVNLRINLKSNLIMNKQDGINLQNIIDGQQKQMNLCPYDKDELELIELNRYQIMEIFSDKMNTEKNKGR